jgi:RND superfamily putative drug exporter
VLRRRWAILAATLVAVALAGAFGGGAIGHLTSGGFDDPAAESVKAAATLRDAFGTGDPNLVLLVTAGHGDVDDPAVARRGEDLTRRLAAEPDLAQVASYWSLDAPSLRSEDRRQALVLGRVTGDEEALDERAKQLTAAYTADGPDVRVQVGGQIQVFREVGEQVERDLVRAEGIAVPITLLLLVVVFASAVAGMLPLAVGGFAIVGTLLLLRLLGDLTDVSIYALNLTTALGLGLAIDYSLFIVSRYREELRAGREPAAALLQTMATAGRTVLFSAATVAAALVALLVFPLYFLRSFGYAGIAVVALAAVGALVVLPALLAVLGRRVDRLRLPVPRRRAPAAPAAGGFWHRLATGVMRRPLPIATAVVALLLLLGTPFLGVRFGLPDDRVLPAGAASRQVADALRAGFAADESSALSVVATGIGDPTGRRQDIDRYATALSRLEDVSRVDALTGSYAAGRRLQGPTPAAMRFAAPDGTWLSVVPSVASSSARGEDLVARVRALPTPFHAQVTGPAAQLVDTKASLAAHLPAAAAIIAAVTFLLLFLMTGSVVVPLKALVLNLLSLTAVYGAMVFVFRTATSPTSWGSPPPVPLTPPCRS